MVKTAITKKDEVIQDLRLNYEKAVEQNEHLEAMLERQTKERVLGGRRATETEGAALRGRLKKLNL